MLFGKITGEGTKFLLQPIGAHQNFGNLERDI